jgi:hypothetical protein
MLIWCGQQPARQTGGNHARDLPRTPLLKQKRAVQSPLFRGSDLAPKWKGIDLMKTQALIASAVLATLAVPLAVHAQGIPGGAAHGIYEGNRRAGPLGAVVGGVVGGVIGGIDGILGVQHYQAYYSEPPAYSEPAPRPARRHRKLHDNSR